MLSGDNHQIIRVVKNNNKRNQQQLSSSNKYYRMILPYDFMMLRIIENHERIFRDRVDREANESGELCATERTAYGSFMYDHLLNQLIFG